MQQVALINSKLRTYSTTEKQKTQLSLECNLSMSTVRNYLKGKCPEVHLEHAKLLLNKLEIWNTQSASCQILQDCLK